MEKLVETIAGEKHHVLMPASISQTRIAELIAANIDPAIAGIDLEMVKIKLAETDEGEDWDKATCENGEKEYKRFLTLCKNYPYPQYSIVPNKLMDIVWHYHILDTRAYCKDSENIFGGYFHHYPYFGLRGDEDAQALQTSGEKTSQLYLQLFDEPMNISLQNCWHDCDGRCWHACKSIS